MKNIGPSVFKGGIILTTCKNVKIFIAFNLCLYFVCFFFYFVDSNVCLINGFNTFQSQINTKYYSVTRVSRRHHPNLHIVDKSVNDFFYWRYSNILPYFYGNP
jgi:hypothetical protein